jgi:hypothetical protein
MLNGFGGFTPTRDSDYIYIALVCLLSIALDSRLFAHGQTPDPSLLRGGIRFLVLCRGLVQGSACS